VVTGDRYVLKRAVKFRLLGQGANRWAAAPRQPSAHCRCQSYRRWSVVPDRIERASTRLRCACEPIRWQDCTSRGELKIRRMTTPPHQQAIDSTTPMCRAMIQMATVFGEQERQIIRSRVLAGLRPRPSAGEEAGSPVSVSRWPRFLVCGSDLARAILPSAMGAECRSDGSGDQRCD
jgi:hypothetical protein